MPVVAEVDEGVRPVAVPLDAGEIPLKRSSGRSSPCSRSKALATGSSSSEAARSAEALSRTSAAAAMSVAARRAGSSGSCGDRSAARTVSSVVECWSVSSAVSRDRSALAARDSRRYDGAASATLSRIRTAARCQRRTTAGIAASCGHPAAGDGSVRTSSAFVADRAARTGRGSPAMSSVA